MYFGQMDNPTIVRPPMSVFWRRTEIFLNKLGSLAT